MNYEDFLQLIQTRQACRDFNDKPLDRETVLKIAKTAMLAPSACNSQPWRMYVVTEPEKLKEVTKALQGVVQNKFLDKAKAYICFADKVATLKPEAMERFDRNHFVKYDVGELVAYTTLAAESMGVQTCIIGWVNPKLLRPAIRLRNDEICDVVVALGYSDAPIRPKKRKSEDDIIVEVE